jgi:hypothetical protein
LLHSTARLWQRRTNSHWVLLGTLFSTFGVSMSQQRGSWTKQTNKKTKLSGVVCSSVCASVIFRGGFLAN